MSRFRVNELVRGQAESLSISLDCPEIIARTLITRGVTNRDSAIRLLHPPKSLIYFSDKLDTLLPVIQRLLAAKAQTENVLVYGDYDVDGIVASVVLHGALRELNIPSNIYLPSRFGEGYGLSKQVLAKAKEDGYDLIVTVDCGTTAVDEVDFARAIGLDIVITDHHEPQDEKPNALILNPLLDSKWNEESKYQNCDADGYYPCGAAVAFALACELFESCGIPSENLADKYLELIALATIADLMKLVGINRALVAHGFDQMLDTLNLGLKALFVEFGLNTSNIPTTEQLSFTIIPALNACGRMYSPRIAQKLLTVTNSNEAKQLAIEIKRVNSMRRDVQEKVFQEAARIAITKSDCDALVLYNPDWHPGVLGIVAAKITELFKKPAVILSSAHGDDGTIRGSARSFGSVDMRACFEECHNFLVKFGGHKVAAGVVVEPSQLEAFMSAMNEAVTHRLTNTNNDEQTSLGIVNLDVEATIFELSTLAAEWIWRLEPIGSGNPAPSVLVKGVQVSNARTIGRDGTTISVTLRDRDFELRTVGFRMSHLINRISFDSLYNAHLSLHPEFFNSERKIRFELHDLEECEG